jgi:protein-tyrosine phosphatase
MTGQGASSLRNFRDIGGFKTNSGKHVCTGRVFRSAALDGLTTDQQAELAQLGIKLVVDFRSGVERGLLATPYAGDNVRSWFAPANTRHGAPGDLVETFTARAPGDKSAMQDVYRAIPFLQQQAFKALFDAIADDETPLVYHCAAGKDRTGVATALLLDTLGVNHSDILSDYFLSQAWFAETRAEFLTNFTEEQDILSKEAYWAPMLIVDATYLASMFHEVERRYGSTTGYLRGELGMTTAAIDRVIAQLTD